jgi:hypothetical protein
MIFGFCSKPIKSICTTLGNQASLITQIVFLLSVSRFLLTFFTSDLNSNQLLGKIAFLKNLLKNHLVLY